MAAANTPQSPADMKEDFSAVEKLVQRNHWGELYYDVLTEKIGELKIGSLLEIGIGFGGHAEHLLQKTAVKQYVGVDPHEFVLDPNDAFSRDVAAILPQSSPQTNFDLLRTWIEKVRLARWLSDGRARLVRKTSVAAARDWKEESLDCIFLDGDHRYAAVSADLKAWYPRVKRGGWFCGDDYWMESVKKAVDEFAAANDLLVGIWRSKKNYPIWFIAKPS